MLPNLLSDPRRWWIFSTIVLAFSVAWIAVSRVPEAAGASRLPSPREGFPAPEVTLPTLAGEQTSLSSYKGQVVILNLWASWCVPCRAEMPVLQKLYEANRERGFVVLAVNSTVQDSAIDAQNFATENSLTFPVLLDLDGSVSRRYLLQALPSTFIIDREGVIQSVIIGGPASEAALQSKIEALLIDGQQ